MACNLSYRVEVPLRKMLMALKELNPNLTLEDFLNDPDVKEVKASKAVKKRLYANNQIHSYADIWATRGWFGRAERAVSSSQVAINNAVKAAIRAGLEITDANNIRDAFSVMSGKVVNAQNKLIDTIIGIGENINKPKVGSWIADLVKEIPYKDFRDFVVYKHIIELNARANEMIVDDFNKKRSYLLNKYQNASTPQAKGKIFKQLQELGNEPKLIDQKGGVTTEEANKILQEERFKGKEQIIRKHYEKFNKIVNIDARLGSQRGQNLTEEQYNQLVNGESGNYTKFDWYVPMEVSREALIEAGVVEGDTSKFQKSGRVKEITLNEGFKIDDRYDPFAVSLYRANAAIDRKNKNEVIETLGNFFTDLKDPSVKVSKIPGKTIVDEFGNFKGFQDLRSQDEIANSLYYYKDGTRYAVTFKPSGPGQLHPIVEVFNRNPLAINELTPPIIADLNKEVQTYMRQMFTSANPLFGMANFARDFGDILLNIESIKKKTGAKNVRKNFIKNIPKAFNLVGKAIFKPHMLTSSQKALWDKYNASGARIAYRQLQGLDAEVKKNKELLEKLDLDNNINKPGYKLPGHHIKRVINLLENYNEIYELTNRFALYKTLLETEGISDLQAAAEARRTMDFNETGTRGKQLGAVWLFFNAGVRGVDRAFETINAEPLIERVTIDGEKKTLIDPTGLQAKMIGSLMVMGATFRLMSEMAGKSDCPILFDKFKKDNYIILPDPTSGDECDFITIPKPYSFFRVPFAIGEVMSDMYTGIQEPSPSTAFGEIGKQVLNVIDPVGATGDPTSLWPTTVRPLAQAVMNIAWHGGEIVPGYWTGKKTQPFYEKSYDYDSKAAKQMSKFLYDNVDALKKSNPNWLSPPALDYIFNSYLNIGLIKGVNDIIVGGYLDPKVKRKVKKRGKKVTVEKDIENVAEWFIELASSGKNSKVVNREFGDWVIEEPERALRSLGDFAGTKRFYSRAEAEERSLFYILERLINVPPEELTIQQYQFFKNNINKIPKSRRGADIKKDFNKKFKKRVIELKKQLREKRSKK